MTHLHDPEALERWFDVLGKTVAVDFDGTIHPYTDGWCGSTPADEEPLPGAREFLHALRDAGFRIVVSSCRADHAEGLDGIRQWLARYGLDFVAEVTHLKPAAIAYVDDRAVSFRPNSLDGNWAACLAQVHELAAGRRHGAAS